MEDRIESRSWGAWICGAAAVNMPQPTVPEILTAEGEFVCETEDHGA